MNLLIKEQGLSGEVVPGTAHTFQGSEAPVVIFDLVLDEPHCRAGLFDPKRNEDNVRLLNVALTRARRRLIVRRRLRLDRAARQPPSVLRTLVAACCASGTHSSSALDVVTGRPRTPVRPKRTS